MTTALPPGDRFGPWADDLPDIERVARLRCMRAIVALHCGRVGIVLVEALRAAETDPAALVSSSEKLRLLPPLYRRRVLASYAALNRPKGGA